MADDATEEEEKGGGGKKKIIIAVVAVAALGAAYQFVLKGSPPEEEAAPEELAMVEPVEGEIHQLGEMVLNIDGETGPAYLRVGVALVLEEGVLSADFAAEEAIASDVIVQYLSAQSVETLRSVDGRTAAKEELATEIRAAYGDAKVVRVLFTSLVTQ